MQFQSLAGAGCTSNHPGFAAKVRYCTWQLSNLQFSKCAPGYGWVLGGLRLGLFNDLQLDIDVDGFANQHPPGF